jgi:hypothetical protein
MRKRSSKHTVLKIFLTRLYLFILLLFYPVIFLSGCNDNTVNSLSGLSGIAGKLVDYHGNPLGGYEIDLISNFQSAKTFSSNDGSFKLNNVIRPYTVSVKINSLAETFKDLTTSNPVLTLNNDAPVNLYNATIIVTIPSIDSNQRASATYFDGTGLFVCSGIFNNPGLCTIYCGWNGNSNTSGKVAITIYTIGSQYELISYDNYGEKPISISNNGFSRLEFDSIDLNTKPSNTNVSGNIYLPTGFQMSGQSVSLNRYSFGSLNNSGILYSYSSTNNNNYSINLPYFGPNIYKYYLKIQLANNNVFCSKIFEVFPGFYQNLYVNPPPQLTFPADSVNNIGYNTIFSFTDEFPAGIYLVAFKLNRYYSKAINLYTSSLNIKIPSIQDTNYRLNPNSLCAWSVTKYTGFNSMDDFVSVPLGNNSKYTEMTSTPVRYFITSKNP